MALSILCADIGTSSLKAGVLAEDGRLIAYSRQQFLYLHTDHAAAEWFPALAAALYDIHEKKPSITVDALCISGNGPTIAVPSGETIRWNDAIPACKTQSLYIPRILAFKKKYPSIWKKSDCILSGPECLIYRLTGNSICILPEERYKKAYWTQEELEQAGFSLQDRNKLPPFVAPGTMAGCLTADAARIIQSPLVKEGTPVFCGAPDFISALVGTNTLAPGKLCDRAGSSEGLNICTDSPVSMDEVRTLPSVQPPLWNASYLLPESGILFSAFKNKIERECGHEIDFNTLVHECISSDMTDTTSSFAQGKRLMNDTALQVKHALSVLAQAVVNEHTLMPTSMTITGGQAANAEWMQMKANITGMKILVPECNDAELTGDAVFACMGMGLFSSLTDGAQALCRIQKIIEPHETI